MSPAPNLTDPQVADLVVRTLAAKSRDAAVPTQPFDPARRTSFGAVDAGGPELMATEPDATPSRGRDHRRVRWIVPLAAAAVALVVVAAGVVVAGRDDRDTTRTERHPVAEQPTDTPDGALLPGWLPEGLVPWGGSWSRPSLIMPSAPIQLFKGDGDAALMIAFQPDNFLSAGGDPVTVRGVEGGVTQAQGDATGLPSFLHWREGGTGGSIDVTYAYMSLDEVVAFLDVLTWRGPDHHDGFEPPTSGDLRLAGEVGPPSTESLTTEYVFGDPTAPPRNQHEGRYLAFSAQSASGRSGPMDYFMWLLRDGEGDIPAADGEPDVEIVEDNAMVSWPDGRVVNLRSRGVSIADLRRVVDSVAPATGQDLDALAAASGARLAALPLVAEVALPSATVELRDGGGLDRAACVHRPGREPACGWLGFTPDAESEDTGVEDASVLIDGTWYALVVGTVPVTLTSEDPLKATAPPLPNELGTSGPYSFALALPANDMQHVAVYRDGSLSYYLTRPESDYPGV
jgi:hypothetical protein